MTHSTASADLPLAERTLADLAVSLPGATALFRAHKLDFCCGGEVPLAKAAAVRALDLDDLVTALAALDRSAAPELPDDADALIDHILARYHEPHRAELPELIRLSRRVEAVHRDNPAVPRGLADALEELLAELDSHMQKEEQVLFPMMRAGGNPMIAHPIARMRFEHDEHGERIRALEALTDGCTVPEGACASWRALYAGTASLIDDLMQHIHIENHMLFPRFTGS
ncbi:MAG TPA: iron-sulfur cluster repair protein YtfE [Alphaproteobacteria bacterium]|jgi:regulator of cell morphogenesis and NO signaling|nr:iron-sulfur cluster repair protein YtfE [Alphaproteobacteria bacterium]